MLADICKLGTQEATAGGLGIGGQPQLYSKCEVILEHTETVSETQRKLVTRESR